MKKIVIISLAVLSFLFTSCEKEGVTMYVQDPTVYFSEDSIVYTFVENMDRIDIGFDTLNIPVLISGMAVDYDRKVNIEIIANDVRHTATAEMFTIGEGLVKSNEYRGYIPLQINYVPELDDSIYIARLKLVPNSDFQGVDLDQNTFTLRLTNKLTEPTNWTRLERYFGPYSNSWYRFILETTGLSSLPYWTTNGALDSSNPDPERWTMTLYEVKAYAAQVQIALQDYNRKHPQDHLKHEDGPEKGKEVVMP